MWLRLRIALAWDADLLAADLESPGAAAPRLAFAFARHAVIIGSEAVPSATMPSWLADLERPLQHGQQ